MKKNEDIIRIAECFEELGMKKVGELIDTNLGLLKPGEGPEAAIASALDSYTVDEKENRIARLLKASRMVEPAYYSDFWNYGVRTVDRELLQDVMELHFIEERRNVFIWGSSGTGKSWVGRAVATCACRSLYRIRWTEFPELIRELRNKDEAGGTALDSRLKYYSRFDLLCIDEFMNMDIEKGLHKNDIHLFFGLIDQRSKLHKSTLVVSQLDPFKMDDFIKPKHIGQAIKGRLVGKATVVAMAGPDLRLYDPKAEDDQL